MHWPAKALRTALILLAIAVLGGGAAALAQKSVFSLNSPASFPVDI